MIKTYAELMHACCSAAHDLTMQVGLIGYFCGHLNLLDVADPKD